MIALLLMAAQLAAPPPAQTMARLRPAPQPAVSALASEAAQLRQRLGSRARRAVLGGAIGAAAGGLACTIIANIAEEEGGFHTCTWKGYALLAGGGAVIGAGVGAVTGGAR